MPKTAADEDRNGFVDLNLFFVVFMLFLSLKFLLSGDVGSKAVYILFGGLRLPYKCDRPRLEVPAESVASRGFPWPPAVAQTAPGRLRSSQPIKADQS